MTALVCGGREWASQFLLSGRVNVRYSEQMTITSRSMYMCYERLLFGRLVHGDADGADRAASRVLASIVEVIAVPPARGEHPKLRNIRMYDEWLPDVVLSFPGGGGTKHMVDYAQRHGCSVIFLPESEPVGPRLI